MDRVYDGGYSRQNGEPLESGRFAVLTSEKRTNGAGETFVTGQLRNRDRLLRFIAGKGFQGSNGATTAQSELISLFEEGQVVDVTGKLGDYRGEPQIEIRTALPVALTAVDLAGFLPRARFSAVELRAAYDAVANLIPSPFQEVVSLVIDPNYPTFATWPAAKIYHHARLGGLAEHSVEVARIALDIAAPTCDGGSACDPVAGVYENRIRRWPTVDLGLLLAAALLHDVGKMNEFAVGPCTSYSDEGQSIGHINLALFMVRDACETYHLDAFDSGRLLHCIASHHGLPECGSAIRPMTAEAIILNHADELSAKLDMVSEALDGDLTGARNWSDRLSSLDRRIWLKAARAARDLSKGVEGTEPDELPF